MGASRKRNRYPSALTTLDTPAVASLIILRIDRTGGYVASAGRLTLKLMRYNVAQLLKEPIGSTRDYRLEERFTGAGRLADGVSGPLRLVKTHQGILVTADLSVETTICCARCLDECSLGMELSVEEEFFPVVDVLTGRRLNVPEGLDSLKIDASHHLELSEMLRQYILTDTPLKPLCRPQCRGLCQGCGVNLNETGCQCDSGVIDPRWSKLAALLGPAGN